MCTGVCSCEFMCLIACYSGYGLVLRSELGAGKLKFVLVMDPIHWRFEDQLMRWSWDLYGLCSEDQTVIRIRNRVISCECLFLCISLFTVASRSSSSYSSYFIWSFDIFYQYDYWYHFMRYQWASILIMQLIWVFINIISCIVVYHFRFRTSFGTP